MCCQKSICKIGYFLFHELKIFYGLREKTMEQNLFKFVYSTELKRFHSWKKNSPSIRLRWWALCQLWCKFPSKTSAHTLCSQTKWISTSSLKNSLKVLQNCKQRISGMADLRKNGNMNYYRFDYRQSGCLYTKFKNLYKSHCKSYELLWAYKNIPIDGTI
jgi:hypothetical protein